MVRLGPTDLVDLPPMLVGAAHPRGRAALRTLWLPGEPHMSADEGTFPPERQRVLLSILDSLLQRLDLLEDFVKALDAALVEMGVPPAIVAKHLQEVRDCREVRTLGGQGPGRETLRAELFKILQGTAAGVRNDLRTPPPAEGG